MLDVFKVRATISSCIEFLKFALCSLAVDLLHGLLESLEVIVEHIWASINSSDFDDVPANLALN